MPYTYDYPRPQVTVDIAVFAPKDDRWQILLIQRKKPPFPGCWALPGGFVDPDEDLPEAAERELQEETGATGVHLEQRRTYGHPKRDPRGRTITVAYAGILDAIPSGICGADDAAEARWFPLDELPPLAFDHAQIVADCWERSRLGDEYGLPCR